MQVCNVQRHLPDKATATSDDMCQMTIGQTATSDRPVATRAPADWHSCCQRAITTAYIIIMYAVLLYACALFTVQA